MSPRAVTDYRLLLHETGDQIFRIPWPPTREGFMQSFIAPYRDSAGEAVARDREHSLR
jgi:hypothetical protein